MNKLIIATVAAVMLGAPIAFADNAVKTVMPAKQVATHPATTESIAERCTKLDERFKKADASHAAGKYHQDAVALHTEGDTFCSTHAQAAGVKYLASGVKIIDAQPKI